MQQFSNIEILEKICQTKMKRLQEMGMNLGYEVPQKREFPIIKPKLLQDSTKQNDKKEPLIITEIKRVSPTKGHISAIVEPTELAKIYIEQGANAISVLCEEDYFHGSLQDLYAVKKRFPNICILRKDFILHKDEARVSYLFGADMVLLIVACFMQNKAQFCEIYEELLVYGLTPLIEIHTLEEWNLICDMDLSHAIIGINSRNLKTFQINKMDTIKLRAHIPQHIPVIFESGIKADYDSFLAGSGGFQGILCGSFLVASLDRDKNAKEEQKDSKKAVLSGLIQAFKRGCEKPIFAKLATRFYAKNQAKTHNRVKPLVKVCGINDLEFLRASLFHADLVGFILERKSARYVDIGFMREALKIYNAYRESKNPHFMPVRVGVVTKECLQSGIACLEEGLIDCLQLHGMPLSFCFDDEAKKEKLDSHTKTMQHNALENAGQILESQYGGYPLHALRHSIVANILPFYPALDYKAFLQVDSILDTYFALWDSSGGTGSALDIEAIRDYVRKNPAFSGNLWLAGGICAANLLEVLLLEPMLLDICSGFESSRGEKSIDSMEKFFSLLNSQF